LGRPLLLLPLPPSLTRTAQQQHRHFLCLPLSPLGSSKSSAAAGRALLSFPLLPPLLPRSLPVFGASVCRGIVCCCRCRSAMGRNSRACSLLGSPLLLLLLSLGCAAAQNASTWKTLSGKLDSLARLPSFLDKFRSV
jgi:hypothetical protein